MNNTITKPNNWKEFYENRIHSTYQQYFENRYRPFLNQILLATMGNYEIVEAGCGIGSVSKFLRRFDIKCSGFDLSEDMVKLANRNNNDRIFYQGNIFDKNNQTDKLIITHGVLEHFSDIQIVDILNLYPNSIHYVPLDKYVNPSFGDERLLSLEHWIDLVKPQSYHLFNDSHDLFFKIKR